MTFLELDLDFIFGETQFPAVRQAPYTPCDFGLFTKLKRPLKRFQTREDIMKIRREY